MSQVSPSFIDGANQIIKKNNLFQSIKSLFGNSMEGIFFLQVASQRLKQCFIIAFCRQ